MAQRPSLAEPARCRHRGAAHPRLRKLRSAAPGAGVGAVKLTVGAERHRNPAVRAALVDFVMELGNDRPPVPAYYRYMAPINRRGASMPRYERTARLSAADLDRWLARGSAVADLRPRRAFVAGHRQGALNIEPLT